MKVNKLTIILIIIIIGLTSYIIYDKLTISKNNNVNSKEHITLVDTIKLDYVNIYLLSNGVSYIAPINEEEINELNINNNLKDRLSTLYLRAFYQDIYINNFKLKGFKIILDDEIKSIKRIDVDNNSYVVFIKENNTIGLFNYLDYIDYLNTDVIDNYNNINNVLDIKNNKLIYLDGSEKELIIEK